MKTKMVADIINDHIKQFDSICDELNKSYDEKSSSACVRRIGLKQHCMAEYDAITSMLRIACALGDCEITEFEKLSHDTYAKFKGTYYGL